MFCSSKSKEEIGLEAYVGSKEWVIDEEMGIIKRLDDKFYFVKPGPHGNPVIVQPRSGDVILSVTLDNMVVCESEQIWLPQSVYRDFESDIVMFGAADVWREPLVPMDSWRVVRKSVDSPGKFSTISGNPLIHLGEAFGNSQRVTGAPENFWFDRIENLPEGTHYFLKTVREVLSSCDGLGIIALGKAMARGLMWES